MTRILALAICAAISFPAPATDWPHWRGENRDGITSEKSGFTSEKNWLANGKAWQTNTGEGAAAPLVVGETVYVFGWEKNTSVLRALNPKDGTEIWRQSHPCPRYGRHARGDQGYFSGATATPEFDAETGLIFTLSADGDLCAWDSKKRGEKIWHLNFYEKFGIEQRPQITKRRNTRRDYGYTCAPFVFENWVIAEVGDPKTGNLHAFDKRTGKPAWRSENRDVAGHSGSLAPMTVDGVPCLAVATSYHALVVRLDGKNAGKTVAEFPWATDFSNTISGVAARGNEFLISSRYNHMAMAKVSVSLKNGAKEIWKNRYPTGVCRALIHEDRIYFANKGIHCIDYQTGEKIWEGGKIGDAGSCVLTGDGRLLVWGNDGDLILVEATQNTSKKIQILAERFRILRDKAWTQVVLANGRIFCKTMNGDLVCFDIP